jgi:putative ABC transport system permease protein
MTAYIQLDTLDLVLAGALLLINGALSLVLRLRLGRQLVIAAVRMIVQLVLVAFILEVLFATISPWLTAAVALVMVAFGGREVVARQQRRFRGGWSFAIGVTAMASAAGAVTVFALTTQIQPDPWYHPRFTIPLLGMVLGNTMTGIALGLDTLTHAAVTQMRAVEARLSLGQPRLRALEGVTRQAMRSALMPTINAMAAAGVVALPGMMTGQILSGVAPLEATKYQLMVMFLIAGGTALGAMAAVLGGARHLTDERHRLRLERLQEPR